MKTFKQHLKDNPDITMVGLAWAVYWRGTIIGVLIFFAVTLFTSFNS